MQTDLFQPTSATMPAESTTMNGKPVHEVPAKSVINFASAFEHKKLCDGLTFSTGSACVYSCAFCYVPDLMRKSPHMAGITQRHEDVVIRRRGAINAMRAQLTDRHGRPKFLDPQDTRVIYSSPLVDVAGNLRLVEETVEACKVILELTNWQIRLLSKSNLLPRIAAQISEKHAQRLIYGVSTGTLDDGLARAFETGTPLVSKRIESLRWLQDRGLRTFGMICPSLPMPTGDSADSYYPAFAREMADALRADKCEHVWGEVINVRGDSMTRTVEALRSHGYDRHADALEKTSTDKAAWERYARQTFEAHAAVYAGQAGADVSGKGPKLRFLQYVTKDSRPWWEARESTGAVLL